MKRNGGSTPVFLFLNNFSDNVQIFGNGGFRRDLDR
jgi:hypothetical protein